MRVLFFYLTFFFLSFGAASANNNFQPQPPLCPIQEYKIAGMKYTQTLEFGRESTIVFPNDDARGNPNVAYRYRVRATSENNEDWTLTIRPKGASTNECAGNDILELNSNQFRKDVEESFLSPLYCDNVRTEIKVETRNRTQVRDLKIKLDIFKGARVSRQLSIVDKEPDASPNWCSVLAYKGVASTPDGPTNMDGFEYGTDENTHKNFLDAINGVVVVGWTLATAPRETERSMIRSESQFLTSCTGFYITDQLVMTNRHCVCPASADGKNQSICSGYYDHLPPDDLAKFDSLAAKEKLVAFDWRIWSRTNSKGGDEPTAQSAEVVALGKSYLGFAGQSRIGSEPQWVPLDYAILRTSTNKNATPVRIAQKDVNRQKLSMLQYPGDYQLSLNFDTPCKVTDEMSGFEYPKSPKFWSFQHGCDSAAGSSGSPIFTRDMDEVIGVHYCCANKSDGDLLSEGFQRPSDEDPEGLDSYNRGIPIKSIMDDLKRSKAELYNEICEYQKGQFGRECQ